MIKRLGQAVLVVLIALDILVQALVKAPVWVLFARAKPSPRETISATLGWGEAKGYIWATVLAGLVDDVFGQGHCRGAYLREQAFAEPI